MKRERRWRPFSASCHRLHHQAAACLNNMASQPPCLLTDQQYRMISLFSPTHSNKSTVTVSETIGVDINQATSKDAILDLCYEQVFDPELKRMKFFPKEGTDDKAYNRGANVFFFLPKLNTLSVKFKGEDTDLHQIIQSHNYEELSRLEVEHSEKKMSLKDAIKEEIDSYLNDRVAKKLNKWEKYGFIKRGTSGGYSEFKYLDSNYMKERKAGDNIDEAIRIAALDYVTNSLIGNANYFMAIAGDLAQYFDIYQKTRDEQANGNINYMDVVKDTYRNIKKRLIRLLPVLSLLIQKIIITIKIITGSTAALARRAAAQVFISAPNSCLSTRALRFARIARALSLRHTGYPTRLQASAPPTPISSGGRRGQREEMRGTRVRRLRRDRRDGSLCPAAGAGAGAGAGTRGDHRHRLAHPAAGFRVGGPGRDDPWGGFEQTPSGTIEETFAKLPQFMGGTKTIVTTADFKGRQATAVMGGCEIDLRRASMPDGRSAVLDTFAFWGGIEIKVPDDWEVVSQGNAVLGGFVNNARPLPGSRKRLVVTGLAIMGGVEVKS